MSKILPLTLLLASALSLAACDKTSEDHVKEANQHTQAAEQKEAQGKPQQAAEEKAKATEEHVEARQERTTEDRHQPPETGAPDYLKAPEKQ